MNRKNKKGWYNDHERHRASAYGIKTTSKGKNKIQPNEQIKKSTSPKPKEHRRKFNAKFVNKRVSNWEEKLDKDVYIRGIIIDDTFDIDKFKSGNSVDYILSSPKDDYHAPEEGLDSKEEVEEILRTTRIGLNKPRLMNYAHPVYDEEIGGWGIEYNGLNAVRHFAHQSYVEGGNLLVLFTGEEKGHNIMDDGIIIEPNKVLEVIKPYE